MWKILKLFMTLFLLIHENKANNYAVVGDDVSFIQPCEPKDNYGNTNLADLVEFHLTHDYEDDLDTIITNGNITINVDLSPDETIMVDMEIYEWKRGQWENTVYSLKRPNFCVSIFDPKELWYPFVMQFPAEELVCPPKKGHVYKLKEFANRLEISNVNIPGDLSGKYKAIIHFVVGASSICVSTVANVWRI